MAVEHSAAKRHLRDKYLRGVGRGDVRTIRRRPTGTVAPLSVSQEEVYRRELRVPGIPPLYNERIAVRVKGAQSVLQDLQKVLENASPESVVTSTPIRFDEENAASATRRTV